MPPFNQVAKEVPQQCAKTLYNLLGHISKDQTVQYLLTLVDDFLQEDKARVAIFRWRSLLNPIKSQKNHLNYYFPGTTVGKGRNQCGQLSWTCSTDLMALSRTWPAGQVSYNQYCEKSIIYISLTLHIPTRPCFVSGKIAQILKWTSLGWWQRWLAGLLSKCRAAIFSEEP